MRIKSALGCTPLLGLALLMGGCVPLAASPTAPGPTAGASRPTAAAVPSATPAPSATAPAGLNGFRIVGYVTDDVIVSQVQLDKLTHINYAFLVPKPDGTLNDVANPWEVDQLVALARPRGVKVLISVGGWGPDKEFEALAASPETRATFVKAVQSYVHNHALDGADIDWEYPQAGDSAQNYLTLMQALHDALRPDGKLLTSAVAALGANADGIPQAVFGLVDYMNIMAYDGPGANHSPYSYAVSALDYWQARGLPQAKTVLGVPFYSRPGEVTYRKLEQSDPAAANTDQLNYMGRTEYYNGIPTLQLKTQLARQRASGIMIWALPQDTNDDSSLLKAIYQAALANP